MTQTTESPLRLLIAALRSGSYPQGYSRLRKANQFSVQGVACDVYATYHPDCAWENVPGEVASYFRTPASYSSILLPRPVQSWLGFDSSDPRLNVKIRYRDLRPEVEGQIRFALEGAEKQDDKLRKGLVAKNSAWRDYWDSIKDTSYEGVETLGSLNDELQMTFLQIASVLSQLDK